MSYVVNNEILSKWNLGKFYKKDIRLVIKEFYKSHGLNGGGLKEIELIGKKIDGGYLISEISYFKNDYNVGNDFCYDILLIDYDGNIVYDESDGEINNKDKIKTYINNFEYLITYDEYKETNLDDIRLKLFYPYY